MKKPKCDKCDKLATHVVVGLATMEEENDNYFSCEDHRESFDPKPYYVARLVGWVE